MTCSSLSLYKYRGFKYFAVKQALSVPPGFMWKTNFFFLFSRLWKIVELVLGSMCLVTLEFREHGAMKVKPGTRLAMSNKEENKNMLIGN
jgi:hypothetical protein